MWEVRGRWQWLPGFSGAKGSEHLAGYLGIGTWQSLTHDDKAELNIAWVTWNDEPSEGQALVSCYRRTPGGTVEWLILSTLELKEENGAQVCKPSTRAKVKCRESYLLPLNKLGKKKFKSKVGFDPVGC